MPAGSYWTQPAGEVHITSSRGVGVAYVEIETGPYLVMPPEEATDNGERPVNVTPSNLVWLDASSTSWIKHHAKHTAGPELAFLWGKRRMGQLNGTLVKLPAGFAGELTSQGPRVQAVVMEGRAKLKQADSSEFIVLSPGGYVSAEGAVTHPIQCDADEGCLVYVRSVGNFTIHYN